MQVAPDGRFITLRKKGRWLYSVIIHYLLATNDNEMHITELAVLLGLTKRCLYAIALKYSGLFAVRYGIVRLND